MRRLTRPSTGGKKAPCEPEGPSEGFTLTGDIEPLKYAFRSTRRSLVGTTVQGMLFERMQRYPGGISAFYEDAVAAYNGDLPALVEAAVTFIRIRKYESQFDPTCNANGRVRPETFERIQQIEQALAMVAGMSRAKVLAGLVQLKLRRESK